MQDTNPTPPADQEIRDYYDQHSSEKLNHYIYGNPRIDAAIDLLLTHVPPDARQALDIGCAVGETTSRISKTFPYLQVRGTDLSETSIQIAKKLFASEKVSFECCDIESLEPDPKYDVITLIDVYEHIHKEARRKTHAILNSLLSEKGVLIATTPSELNQISMHTQEQHRLQPIDEPVTLKDAMQLAQDIDGTLLEYSHKSIWKTNDYLHLVVAKRPLFTLLQARPRSLPSVFRSVSRRLNSYYRKIRINRLLRNAT